jgi:hypothetical protein
LTGIEFPWILIGLAAVVDVVGFFYLWRRRNLVGTNHRAIGRSARPLRIPLAERRRRERRGAGKAAAV